MNTYNLTEYRIREERATDLPYIARLIKLSFKNSNTLSLVSLLRKRKEYIRDFSLVAEINGIIAGYILLSPVKIMTEYSRITSLWMEPLCVHPNFRYRGIGAAMIRRSLIKGKMLGYESVFVTGSFDYYSRFGFRKATDYGIDSSVYLPSNAFLAIPLNEHGLDHRGKLIFPEEIFG